MPIEDLWNKMTDTRDVKGFSIRIIDAPRPTLGDADKCRLLCEQNVCKNYGTNWGCPPGAGNVGDNLRSLSKYDRAAVVSKRWKVSHKDTARLREASADIQNIARDFMNILRDSGYQAMALADGGCNYCGGCRYPEPCEHPDQRVPSVSAYGVMMMEYLEDHGIPFRFEEDYVTLYALVLYKEK